jgi:tetratricopeptide (TPR) repeat protein
VDHQPRAELEKLLISLLTEADVRRIVRLLPGGEDMHAELPGTGVSLTALVHQAVSVLERHGQLDGAFFEVLGAERPRRNAEIRALAARMLDAAPAVPPDEWLGALPVPLDGRLVGRQQEINRLDAAWADPGTRALSIVAWGGAGKSTLVHHWLERMRQDGWRGARKIYGWSFYAQGTQDTNASAEAFFADALDFFGVPASPADTLQTRVRKLVTRVRQQPTLLVLDGLEPLQEPPRDLDPGGKLRDSNLAMFLRELARDMKGLYLITSRLSVKDLATRSAAPVLVLDRLSTADGAALLRDLGVRGSQAELRATADEQDGHALALMLLGKYLHEVHAGDIGRRHGMSMLAAAEAVESGKLKRIMAAYDAWLDTRARAAMRLVGLFDRPADAAALASLRRVPPIPVLTDTLMDLNDEDWSNTLRPLRKVGLLAPESPQNPGTLDAHPLVRAYFGERLRREQPESWRAAHERLYEHYLGGPSGVPASLAELGRMVDAVIHGCYAGRHAEAYRKVYRGRIHVGVRRNSVTRFGAFGLELSAVAAFMERRWDRPVTALESAAQADILEVAGYDLRALGRLAEALVPAQIALELDQAGERWDPAAVDASLLAEIELLLGQLDAAQSHARLAVDLANRATLGQRNDAPFRRLVNTRTLLGEVLQCAGRFEESQALFGEAERLQRQHKPKSPQLIALPGARYCALLLDLAMPLDGSALSVQILTQQSLTEARQRCVEVRQRAELLLERAGSSGFTQFTLGMQRLNLGQAHLGLWLAARALGMPAEDSTVVMHRNQAAAALDLAVDELRQSGRDDTLPRALLGRAALHRFLDHPAGAELDLAEVEELADRSGMRLLECDAHLERARLALAGGNTTSAHTHTEAARVIVSETGYHRRDRELAALEAALSRGH